MRDYAKIGPKFWIGTTGKKLRAAGMECQIVSLYLMSSPHANMLGLYYIPLSFIAHETGLPFEGAKKGLQSAIKAGFCEYDDNSEMVWVVEMARFQVADALKDKDLRIKGVQNEYDSLPENPFLSRFYDMYSGPFCMTERRTSTVEKAAETEAPSKPLASQEQEQEQEQEKEQEQKSPQSADAPPPVENDLPAERREKRRGTAADEKCARWLYGVILDNNPEATPPNIPAWANEIRLMRERDHRTLEAICELFQWAQLDDFWCANILSPASLRAKWDQLTMQRKRKAGATSPGTAPTDLAAAQRAANEEAKRRLGIGQS